jgi:myo-inositol-1(or 4)-monophosphatase
MSIPDPTALPLSSTYPYREALVTAVTLARQAGALLLDIHRQGPQRIERKSTHFDLVTEADVASQELILGVIRARFPDDGILAEEEGGSRNGSSGAVWIVDPLDGTTNFAHRYPAFAVSIGMWVNGRPELGVVQDVVREHTYWGAVGQGAWINQDHRLQVSQTGDLQESLVATGFPYSRAINPDNNMAEYGHIVMCAQGVRQAGSAALELALLADGRLDGYWEGHLSSWDYAAGVLLVSEAGGRVTGYDGQPLQLGRHQVVASNGPLHDSLWEAVRTARERAGLSIAS